MGAATAERPLEAVRPAPDPDGEIRVRHFSALRGRDLAKRIEDFIARPDVTFISLTYAVLEPPSSNRERALLVYLDHRKAE